MAQGGSPSRVATALTSHGQPPHAVKWPSGTWRLNGLPGSAACCHPNCRSRKVLGTTRAVTPQVCACGSDNAPPLEPNTKSMPLIKILFTSVIEDHDPGDQTAQIMADSTRCNAPLGVSSVLLAVDGRFLQCIEGPSDAVYAAMTRILADARHHSVIIIDSQQTMSLAFGAVGMRMVFGSEAQRAQGKRLLDRVAIDSSRELAHELVDLLQHMVAHDRSAATRTEALSIRH
jgi:hypothetical protein